MRSTRILGLDPSLTSTGYGVVDYDGRQLCYIHAGCIQPPDGMRLEDRLLSISMGVASVLREYQPLLVAVEDVHMHYANSALLLGHVRGAVLLTCALAGKRVKGYPAATVKHDVTGRGNAPKAKVADAVSAHLRLNLRSLNDDATDALAVAITHAFSRIRKVAA